MLKGFEGDEAMPLRNMPLRHEDYLELKTIENQHMQKESLLELSLSEYKKQLLRNKAAINSFFRVGLLPKGIPQIKAILKSLLRGNFMALKETKRPLIPL